MFNSVEVVEVILNGLTVGAVSKSSVSKNFIFEYSPKWLQNGFPISPINLPLEQKQYIFNGLNSETFYGLPPALIDSLPDKFGNSIVTSELLARGASYSQITALDRLAYTGKRGMGALEYKPVIGPRNKQQPDIIQISELVDAAKLALSGNLQDENMRSKTVRDIISVGTSAGGARAKAVLNIDAKTKDITSGQFPQAGKESWLLKFDGVDRDNNQLSGAQNYCAIEYAYSLMAKAAGIKMPETKLLLEGERSHFMVKRFDRILSDSALPKKLHYQSLCAVAIADYNVRQANDYAILFDVIEKLTPKDKEQAFIRMVFNYLAANCDDHTKNHGFLLNSFGEWELSPAFDITFAYDKNSAWLNQHLMGVNGKFQNVTKKEFINFARKHHIPNASAIIKKTQSVISQWGDFAKKAGLSANVSDSIWTEIKKILI